MCSFLNRILSYRTQNLYALESVHRGVIEA